MTSRGCCVLVYDSSGDPEVRPNEPRVPRTDVSGSQFEVTAPTLEEKCGKKKKKKRRRARQKGLSRLCLRVGCSLFYLEGFHISI